MELYHGSDSKFEKFDFSKSVDGGVYFTDEKNAAAWYGKHIYSVKLNSKHILDLSSVDGVKTLLEKCPVLISSIEEEAGEEMEDILEDDEYVSDSLLSFFSDCGMCFEDENGNDEYVREYILAELKKEYDCVILEDYTDGDYHKAYIVFSNEGIEYIN